VVDPSRVVVATDADRAGRRAAHAAYWRLTAVDADRAVLLLPEGLDPASVLQEEGPDAVRRLIIAAPALADRLVADLLSGQDWSLPGTHGRVTKGAAAILAARPAIEWPAAIERLRSDSTSRQVRSNVSRPRRAWNVAAIPTGSPGSTRHWLNRPCVGTVHEAWPRWHPRSRGSRVTVPQPRPASSS
jgi:DNA primase